jgi:ribosomal protein L37AE/L43A
MIQHIVKEWRSDTKIYTCVCGYQSKENIKTHSLDEVTCLDCLRLTVKRQSNQIAEMKKLGNKIYNFGLKED